MAILSALNRTLLGQSHVHRLVLTGVLARGHVLLEGMPGLGKTAMIHALGQLLGLDNKRVQFTPDLMPSDIIGSTILQPTGDGGREMTFQEGPVFTNILLADEINRASPKTQSALLEAMQERRVTVLGTTRALPSPFFVLASQNPIELEGTYPLPEAQLDRFLLKVDVHMPGADVLEEIISSRRRGEGPPLSAVVSEAGIGELFNAVDAVQLPKAVARYIARLVSATHPGGEESPEEVNRFVKHGASPRAAIGIAEASRAWALLAGRTTVGFEDVKNVAVAVLTHRVILSYEARFERMDSPALLKKLLASLDEVDGALPKGARVTQGANAGSGAGGGS